MTPPETPAPRPGDDGATGPAVSFCVLRHRPDFLRAAKAMRQGTPGFMVQARRRDPAESAPDGAVRVGFTCSKKIGNAVARNRARRRLREVARAVMPGLARPGWDYVLVGRPQATIARPFAELLADLDRALRRIHGTGA
ncbi:ribonuclease P protein component [Paracoccus sp. p4-l81]|uniref:ribonuclease P protein component n=1 Tax=Paracoccus sp. p4-l81 TaxID=3342806 RepID=UPI0035BAF900